MIRKANLVCKNMVQSVRNERNILAQANNPFVVRFYYSFTSVDNLYIVMEYVSGGDMYSLLRTMGALDEAIARVYIAEAVLALEYCHTQVGAVPVPRLSELHGLTAAAPCLSGSTSWKRERQYQSKCWLLWLQALPIA